MDSNGPHASNASRVSSARASIVSLKRYARVLHRRVQQAEPEAMNILRRLREFKQVSDAQLPAVVQRKHCLTASAVQLGFHSWTHACNVFEGRADDFGTLLYPSTCYGHTNIWSANYTEADTIRREHGGYLLAYRRQFLIVEAPFIDSLGLDPADPDWEAIGRDWVHPFDAQARGRLYEKLVHNTLVRETLAAHVQRDERGC